jgi:toxin ParE1/3/4
MRLELVYSASALADLEAVLLYIALDNPRAARQWVADIEKRCELLCEFPELGVERDDLVPGIRIFPYRRAVIVYRIQRMRIRIVRVFYGGQDYATLMDF